MSGDARGYAWPPFQPGNDLGQKFEEANDAAVTHGATSAARVEPRARELAPMVLGANPHLDPMRDGHAVYRYCLVLARCERVYKWLGAQDDFVFDDAEAGTAHGVHERLSRWERQAAADEDRLGIAPLTRAKLGLDMLRAAALTDEEKRAQQEARARLDARMDGKETADEG